ncbi:ABC transporter [Plasmodium gonderi]|uniref:ABC transporter n=1 Tax=Plasmodium gonderi TaxID=77519 RepID=A0A1Y1JFC8_PLAGO|nr:ABC transporter [Plasmodium gonderi]GAW81216.1 ABC transporter [Plasmodium gonderi]
MWKYPILFFLFVVLLPIMNKKINAKRNGIVKKNIINGYDNIVRKKKCYGVVYKNGKGRRNNFMNKLLYVYKNNGDKLTRVLCTRSTKMLFLKSYWSLNFILCKFKKWRKTKFVMSDCNSKKVTMSDGNLFANMSVHSKGTTVLCAEIRGNSKGMCEEREIPGNAINKFFFFFFKRVRNGIQKCVKDLNKFVEEDNMLNFLWIHKNVLCKKNILFLTLFVMIHSAIISIIIPRCDNFIFHNLANRKFENFFYLLLNCILVRVINMCLCGLRNYIFMVTSADSLKTVKKVLFEIYIKKENEYYDQVDHSIIINKLTLEAHDFADIIPYYINPFIRNFFSIIFNFAYIFYLNYKLSIVILGCFFISSVLTMISTKMKKKRIKSINREKARNTKISLEALNNINIIKLFSTELHEYNKYSESLSDILNLQKKKEQFNLFHMVVNKLFVFITYILILLKGDVLLRSKEIDRNTFTSFFFYINNIYSYIDILDYYIDICDIVNQYHSIIRLIRNHVQSSIERSSEDIVIQSCRNISDKEDNSSKGVVNNEIPSLRPCINNISKREHEKDKTMGIHFDRTDSSEKNVVLHLKNVYFKYRNTNNYVLKNLNLKILKNTNNVILGKSGGGKSTLLKLILNLYKSSRGKIYLYNKPICSYTNREIMNKISYVQQDSKLLKGTIKENLTYGITDDSNNFDMLDLVNISKCCTCHEFISRLRKRYETFVSNKTELLTSSQKQKMCIARALSRYPKILLLDESTSSLNKDNERIIFQNIKRNPLFKNLTIIRITHKKANLDLSDNIFLLNEGYITRQKYV